MLEIEQKFAGADFAVLEGRLVEWGAHPSGDHVEADYYLAAPDRDFRRTHEAFRLRTIGPSNLLTYKGPRLPGAVKIRTELEVPLRDGPDAAEQMLELLGHLGYRQVAIVRKRRRQFSLERRGFTLHVCLDEVEHLGRFAEVEVLAPEDKVEAARAVLLETAAELGLSGLEPRSYLGLLMQKLGLEGKEAGT